MDVTQACQKCSLPLTPRNGRAPRFCPSCGAATENMADAAVPFPTPKSVIETAAVPSVQSERTSLPVSVPVQDRSNPRPSSSLATPAPKEAEAADIRTWRWNWGAFLVPGLWMFAHGIRPKLVPTLLLGLPMLLMISNGVVAVVRARTAEANYAANSGTGNASAMVANWSEATVFFGVLLALYISACVSSTRVARRGSQEAWSNYRHRDLRAFISAQRVWGGIGLILLTCLICSNVVAQLGFIRATEAKGRETQIEYVLSSAPWTSPAAVGQPKLTYEFKTGSPLGERECQVLVNGKALTSTFFNSPASFSLSADYVWVTLQEPQFSNHRYALSADQQTLTEVGGDGRVFRRGF